MKKFRCGDVVPGCDWGFRGSEEEILLAVAGHAAAAHGLLEVPADLVDRVRGAFVPA